MKSSAHEWSTPANLFSVLQQEFCFDLDVCALPENAKCRQFFTPEMDGLKQPWRGACWMNPPYGREIYQWLKKAYEESRNSGTTVVALVPSRTNAPWWHEWAMKADEIRFVRKKVAFISNKGRSGVPFYGSVVLVFRGGESVMPIVLSQEQK